MKIKEATKKISLRQYITPVINLAWIYQYLLVYRTWQIITFGNSSSCGNHYKNRNDKLLVWFSIASRDIYHIIYFFCKWSYPVGHLFIWQPCHELDHKQYLYQLFSLVDNCFIEVKITYCLGSLPIYILGSNNLDWHIDWCLHQSTIWCQNVFGCTTNIYSLEKPTFCLILYSCNG